MFFFVDVPLIFFCPADHVPEWQPRVLLGMVEARSVNVKKTTMSAIYFIQAVYGSWRRRVTAAVVLLKLSTHPDPPNREMVVVAGIPNLPLSTLSMVGN